MTFELLREWIGGGLAVLGGLFTVIGALGLIRMPDVFTRLHAASVVDTAGAWLIFVGLIVLAGFTLTSVKLVFLIMVFGLMTPVATHAVARAALHAGVKPVVDADGTEGEPDQSTGEAAS